MNPFIFIGIGAVLAALITRPQPENNSTPAPLGDDANGETPVAGDTISSDSDKELARLKRQNERLRKRLREMRASAKPANMAEPAPSNSPTMEGGNDELSTIGGTNA